MSAPLKTDFKKEFLEHYLHNGLGSMPKADIDALVMHLIDTQGTHRDCEPLQGKSNQEVSELLKTPVSKIKKLRYEAALKYGEDAGKRAKALFLVAIACACFEESEGKICIIIESQLVKNWLQGQLKKEGVFYDNSFNSEVIRIKPKELFGVLNQLFGEEPGDVKELEKQFNKKNLKNNLFYYAKRVAEAAGVFGIFMSYFPK
jgi:hypothetical protein